MNTWFSSVSNSPVIGLICHDRLDLVAEELDPVAPIVSYAGNISTTSPRTRNVPRLNSMSFRSYCRSISACSRSSPRSSDTALA